MKYAPWERADIHEDAIMPHFIHIHEMQYRWVDRVGEGWGLCTIWYDPDQRIFYRSMQEGAKGHGRLTWSTAKLGS